MNELKIPLSKTKRMSTETKSFSNGVRLSLVKEAKRFKGDKTRSNTTNIFKNKAGRINFRKPGKEVFVRYLKRTNGTKGNNKNDMNIMVHLKKNKLDNDGTFSEIFREFNKLINHKNYLRVLGALLVRNAFCLDHQEISAGVYRYSPPTHVIKWLKRHKLKEMMCDVELFLHYIDSIAWNEDIKYHTLGYDITKGYGRRNNLLTYANIIAVLLGEIDFLAFAGGLMRPPVGVNPISLKESVEIYDLLWSSRKSLPKSP